MATGVQRIGIVWPQLQGFLGIRQSLRRLTSLEIGPRPTVVVVGVFRVDLDRLGVIGNRLVELAFFAERRSSIAIRFIPFRSDLDRLGVVGYRLVGIALRLLSVAAIVIVASILRIELDRLRVIGYSSVVVLLGVVGEAAVAIRFIPFRADLDRLGVVGYRLVEIALRLISIATIVKCCRILGIDLDRLGIVGNRSVVVLVAVCSPRPRSLDEPSFSGAELNGLSVVGNCASISPLRLIASPRLSNAVAYFGSISIALV